MKIFLCLLMTCFLYAPFSVCATNASQVIPDAPEIACLPDISSEQAISDPIPPVHTNSIGMEFVLISAGSFLMGCSNHHRCYDDETPKHVVNITKPFYMGKFEVTQDQWMAVMGKNPSKFQGVNNPVENVSWLDVQVFVRQLNQKEGTNKYRLPTEAEWEYAARAGTTTEFGFGNDGRQLSSYAWYNGAPGSGTHPVGQNQPNNWGLYDMHGNVWEWVQDWYWDRYYDNSSDTDPKGPDSGEFRVLRGGGWRISEWLCRSAVRYANSPDYQNGSIGFRLVFSSASQ